MANKNKTTIIVEPGKQEMRITREFDAPRELVFQAFTDPELYVQWLGPRRLTTMLDTFEPEMKKPFVLYDLTEYTDHEYGIS